MNPSADARRLVFDETPRRSPVIELMFAALLAVGQTEAVAVPSGLMESRNKALEKNSFFGGAQLSLTFKISGPGVLAAVKIGNVKVTEATDDTGTSLIGKGSNGEIQSEQPDMRTVGQYERNKDVMSQYVWLKAPPRSAKSVSFKGSVDLLVGGTPANAEFAGIDPWAEKELAHAELEAVGIKVKLHKSAFNNASAINFVLEGNTNLINSVEYVDSAGKVAKSQNSGWSKFGNGPKVTTYYFQEKLAAGGTLRFVVLKGAKTVTVPLVLEKTDLP